MGGKVRERFSSSDYIQIGVQCNWTPNQKRTCRAYSSTVVAVAQRLLGRFSGFSRVGPCRGQG
jgi:hypothetical protein